MLLLRRGLLRASPSCGRMATAMVQQPIAAHHHCRLLSTAASTKRQSLYELCASLPSYGVGSKVYRKSWEEKGYDPQNHHVLVTRTKLAKSASEPEAWGVKFWKGQMEDGKVRVLNTAWKREWHLLEAPSRPQHVLQDGSVLVARNPRTGAVAVADVMLAEDERAVATALFEERSEAKRAKRYEDADAARQKLQEMGVRVFDNKTPAGKRAKPASGAASVAEPTAAA